MLAGEEPVGEPDAPAVIAVQRLSKSYATRTEPVMALDSIDFAIGDGEFVAVVGPSGCGKSTLLKILAGLSPASSGSAFLRGTPIVGPRRDIGVVFQSPVLFPWRSVLDNVMLPADVQRLDRPRHERAARELLALVGLAEFERRYPWELSGGMQPVSYTHLDEGDAADGQGLRRQRDAAQHDGQEAKNIDQQRHGLSLQCHGPTWNGMSPRVMWPSTLSTCQRRR